MKYLSKVKYPDTRKNNIHWKTSMKNWLSKKIEFYPIEKAEFSNRLALGTVEFDKDHCIYVLVEQDIFKSKKKKESD